MAVDQNYGRTRSRTAAAAIGQPLINTAPHYMAEREGSMFPAKAFELEVHVNFDETIFISPAPDFSVKFTYEYGRLAKGVDVKAVIAFVLSLVVGSKEFTNVQTDGFIDVCNGSLNKGTASQCLLRERPFKGSFCIAAEDNGTDEAMFQFVQIRVGMSGQRFVMPRKRHYHWKQSYADEFGLKVASINEQSRRVDSAICRFCQTFGREVDAVVRKRAKTKAFQFFKKGDGRDNIQVSIYMQEKNFAHSPSTAWWIVAKIVHVFLKSVVITFDILQMADAHLSQQMGNLERLCEELKSNCGAIVDDRVVEFGVPITIFPD
ncbi:hypothetical protein AXG93_2619s1140 [Marchantia polymorpha subsp. ruderalis]|uniref:Uncharacterized protein n=1 Tax=Marchantia polymorpha subsp. ruderalis TaxID=1480154 RepID=A0A176VPA2_MARPO|nr:hypothetical protein AXG93_2619s1140 [Marchantia polymorpha subsp. ruderalis]